MGWLYDEDINAPTVDKFKKAGILGLHIDYDLHYGGKEDKDVVEIARKLNKTILTANPIQYLQMSNYKFRNMGGVWIVNTKDPDEQVTFIKDAITKTHLTTYSLRKEKKVDIHQTYIKVIDCRTNIEKQFVRGKHKKHK